MSVIVEQLTKQFGNQKAVHDLSFSAQKGEILGFLGPNGAGKSTTMKMITGYMQPTAGNITVCGDSPVEKARSVQQKIGYHYLVPMPLPPPRPCLQTLLL